MTHAERLSPAALDQLRLTAIRSVRVDELEDRPRVITTGVPRVIDSTLRRLLLEERARRVRELMLDGYRIVSSDRSEDPNHRDCFMITDHLKRRGADGSL